MKIGICTTDFQRQATDCLFEKIAGMGYECVQLSFDSILETGFQADSQIEIPASVSPEAVEAILRAAQRHRLEITAVNGTFNMAHPDQRVREEGIRRFEGFARAVRELGCDLVSLCSGTRSRTSLWTYSSENDGPEAWRDMADSMRRVCDMAEKYQLTLAIETEASNVISSPERAERILRETGSSRLKMIMDCANLFPAGQARREHVRPIIGHAFDVFGRQVALAHGKDIRESEGIDFCAAGEGIVDFPYFLERLKDSGYQGVMMLHGIYEEQKMLPCRQWMEALIKASTREKGSPIK